MKHKTIVRRILEGEEFDLPSEVYKYIERWHSGNSHMSLAAYLGISDWMYKTFVTNPGYVYEWMEKLKRIDRKDKRQFECRVNVIEKKRKRGTRKSL